MRRIEQDLDLARKELERLRKECLLKGEDLKRVEGHNARVQEAQYEQQVEALEVKLREAEAIRKELQYKLEFACSQWECRVRLFVKESEDRSKQSSDMLTRIQQLMSDLRVKAQHEADLHKQREHLAKKQHENLERNELIEDYRRESQTMDKLIRDVQLQKQEIEREIDQINRALEERLQKLNEQLQLLDVIRREASDYKKELERLHYRVKDLNKHIEKYRSEIARLEEEREQLQERVSELETLVAKREEDILDMEGQLAQKEKLIAELEARLRALNAIPV